MRTMIIEFNYRRKPYRFSKYIKDDFVAPLEAEAFLTECCKKNWSKSKMCNRETFNRCWMALLGRILKNFQKPIDKSPIL